MGGDLAGKFGSYEKHPLLTTPIGELNVSPEFLEMTKVNGFQTVSDVLSGPLYIFHTLPGSGYRMLRELVNLLESNGLRHLVH